MEDIRLRIKRIEDHIDGINQERILRIEEDVKKIDKDSTVTAVLFDRSIEIQEKLNCSLDRLNKTIRQMRESINVMHLEVKGTVDSLVDLKEYTDSRLKETDDEIDNIKNSLKVLEDQGKINFIVLIKNNIVKVLSALIALALGSGIILKIQELLASQ